MRALRLPPGLLERIQAECVRGYPEEVCGFLFSDRDGVGGPDRTVTSAEPAPNVFDGERRRRFVISPGELRSAEARAEARGEVVSGFYHSHPDHPAVPSAFDTENAWPWYAYLVVSVVEAAVRAVGAFELEPDRRRFTAVPLAPDAATPPAGPAGPLAGPRPAAGGS